MLISTAYQAENFRPATIRSYVLSVAGSSTVLLHLPNSDALEERRYVWDAWRKSRHAGGFRFFDKSRGMVEEKVSTSKGECEGTCSQTCYASKSV